MKIGLAIYNFDPRKGGAERYAFDLATRLAGKGHEAYVFCSNGVPIEGVTLIPVNTTAYPRWLRTLSFALNHRKAVKSVSLGVVLGFGNTLEADVYQSHGGVQRIWMEREIASYDNSGERVLKAFLLRSSIQQRIQRWIEEYAIRQGKCAKIVAISDMLKGHMCEHYNLPAHRIDVVYNGVDTERFTPAGMRREGPLKILFSGGNFRLKGLLPLLFALKEVSRQHQGFRLLVMGRGRKERYRKVIEEMNLANVVTFLGETASPELVYRDAHVLAHPTFYDACSLTVMEAMASGLPVITTQWNGASAFVSAKEGYVIDDPNDIAGLSFALGALFDEDRRFVMGEHARMRIVKHTMDRNAQEMEEILEQARR